MQRIEIDLPGVFSIEIRNDLPRSFPTGLPDSGHVLAVVPAGELMIYNGNINGGSDKNQQNYGKSDITGSLVRMASAGLTDGI